MTSKTGQQIITIHILPNIWISKDDQTMKFGQLIEGKMKKIFVRNHAQNTVEKLARDSVIKN